LITIALIGSLIGMLAAAITQKNLGGTPNCISTETYSMSGDLTEEYCYC